MAVEKHAIINGSEVVNVILLDSDDSYTPPSGNLVLPSPDEVSIGWQRIGDTWVAPEESPATAEPTESTDDISAKYEAVQELIEAGISQNAALRIVGLPVEA